MPHTVLWYARTALLYLVAAFALGVWYQLAQWLPGLPSSPYLIVVHTHLALVGGVVQMIMGVGLWMFPLKVPVTERLPYREGLAWLTYGLFNGGLLGRFIVEALFRSTGA
ncbi:MAG TPA: hypothetical protein VL359_19085, partial [bacterium]|nr:hypothetical protein [bacterium]